jgi:hypothetical protein
MGGPRRPIEVKEMKKPKWKVGEIIPFTFLGKERIGKILELKKHPQNIDKWIYHMEDVVDGIKIPYVGIDGSEKFANVDTKIASVYKKS